MTFPGITEIPNPLTRDIDISDAGGILGMLEASDAQMFRGYEDFPGLTHDAFLDSLGRAHDRIVSALGNRGERGRIVLSGAGTSGRLAMLMAEAYNPHFEALLGYRPLDFLIAGGPLALIVGQEGAEDDPLRGMEDLNALTGSQGGFLFLGITCGLSAQYVSGQMYRAVVERRQPAFLVGFNPLDRARDVLPENWDYSFADVIARVREEPGTVFLNPVVGPEPITGSTRMKGGTATKIIVECLLGLSLATLREGGVPEHGGSGPFVERAERVIRSYEEAKNWVYAAGDSLVPLMESAGASLNARGHLYYLGEGAAGRLGIVDASECPPTFGADFSDVRGFIQGGWAAFCPGCGDFAHIGPPYDIGVEDFRRTLLPEITENDTLVLAGTGSFLRSMASLLRDGRKARTFRIRIPEARAPLADADLILEDFAEGTVPVRTSLALKLIYNAVSTAAHIFRGKVFQNRMIDLRISNNKLYHRCLRILQDSVGVDARAAEEALLRSIYRTDAVTDAMRASPVSAHIREASGRERIVPVALVLASGPAAYAEARARVDEEHIVRNIIDSPGG